MVNGSISVSSEQARPMLLHLCGCSQSLGVVFQKLPGRRATSKSLCLRAQKGSSGHRVSIR